MLLICQKKANFAKIFILKMKKLLHFKSPKSRNVSKIFFALFFFITIYSCTPSRKITFYTPVPNSIFDYFNYKTGKTPIVSVHRGGGNLIGLPENCIESFEYIVNKIPCIIECDIEMSKDSIMVLMHDKSLERTSTGSGLVAQSNYEDIKKLKLEDNFGNLTEFSIPTLEKTLLWGKNRVIFTLDVKKTTPYRLVMNLVKKMDAINYSAIITYNLKEAVEVYDIDPNFLISVSLMQPSDYDRLHEAGIPDKNMVAFIGTREPKPEFIEFLHNKGIMCILGVLGNLDKKAAASGDQLYSDFIKSGVDIFATDRPEAVYSVINKIK